MSSVPSLMSSEAESAGGTWRASSVEAQLTVKSTEGKSPLLSLFCQCPSLQFSTSSHFCHLMILKFLIKWSILYSFASENCLDLAPGGYPWPYGIEDPLV